MLALWTTSSKWTAIILVHFGSHFTFFLQLTPVLTHCILSSFGQIVFIFSQRSNPNRRFHLFSFRESVFSGIFSGTGIVWKGVSFCTPLLLFLLVREVSTGERPCLLINAVILSLAAISKDSFFIEASHFTLIVSLLALLLCIQHSRHLYFRLCNSFLYDCAKNSEFDHCRVVNIYHFWSLVKIRAVSNHKGWR